MEYPGTQVDTNTFHGITYLQMEWSKLSYISAVKSESHV